MSKRHLVTGAAGLIGYEIARQLLQRGDRVVAIDSYRKGGSADLAQLRGDFPGQMEILAGDLCDPQTLRQTKGEIDSIFHMAAIVGVAYVNDNPYETLRVNTLSTINVTDFAEAKRVTCVVFASSSENYATAVDKGWVELPTPEEVPLCIGDIALPRWSYAVSKIAGESAVFAIAQRSLVRPVVVRFHNVYGPRMGPTHVIPEFLARVRSKQNPFPVYGFDATRSFLYVDDAARAVLLAHDSQQAGIFNVGSPEEVSIESLLSTIFDVCDFHPIVEKHPAPPGSVKRRVSVIAKIQSLGFEPRIGLKDGIRRCFVHQDS